ncbi:hypothetical protein ALNOE001_21410 [Candidatus Methanobinarius endosymbioticus]|uniref:ADP ribosyltransferase domain-containing protein n=1 Tax=Candidatus Methanobinarius endosymbioticus TaxID=2006182 RepID=A0A366M9X3_9EURY|nr:hypothetical protein ALNOE001_21410 [Candidatus Methanobinarius endosymbioticus]
MLRILFYTEVLINLLLNSKQVKKISDMGFASTSFDKGISKYFAGETGTIIHIDVPKGTKGVYIRQNSKYPQQVEFSLKRNTKLIVHDKKGNNNYCILKNIYRTSNIIISSRFK